MEAILSGVSKTQARKLLGAQINVRVKVLGTITEDKLALTKASVPELVAHLCKLIELGVPDDHSDLVDIFRNHDGIVGMDFGQKWSQDEGKRGEWCAGTISNYLEDSAEYKMVYSGDEICFMTVDELLTDMGNLDIHYMYDCMCNLDLHSVVYIYLHYVDSLTLTSSW